MLKRLFVFVLFFIIYSQLAAQIPGLTFTKQTEHPTLYLKSKTIWVTATPFFFVERKFSPDQGSTYLNVGMFGGNLKPYVQDDSVANRDLTNYKLTRIFGIAQMGVVAPLLAYKHFYPGGGVTTGEQTIDESLNQEEQTGYLTAAIIVFFTGTLTYHVFSKDFLFDALERYNYILGNTANLEQVSFKLNMKIDPVSQTPQLAFVWTF